MKRGLAAVSPSEARRTGIKTVEPSVGATARKLKAPLPVVRLTTATPYWPLKPWPVNRPTSPLKTWKLGLKAAPEPPLVSTRMLNCSVLGVEKRAKVLTAKTISGLVSVGNDWTPTARIPMSPYWGWFPESPQA